MQEHFQDEYVRQAMAKGYRSRAVFKLMELQEKDRLIRPGMNIVDLGAAPGGWSEYARNLLHQHDRVIALDMLDMDPMPGVDIVVGDFREQAVLDRLYQALGDAPVNLVMSDMAPNLSGNKAIDQPRSLYLAELALDTAQTLLVNGGAFLVKIFQGAGSDQFVQDVRRSFASVVIRKPKASRARSNEVYVLAKGFK